jgi:hypothetical protein
MSDAKKADPTALISVSIDIAGSTAAKGEIVDLFGDDEKSITREYEQLLRQFYSHEAEFYLTLTSFGIPIEDIFFIKSIGDEVWIVLPVRHPYPSREFNELANSVLYASLVSAGREVRYTRAFRDHEGMDLDETDRPRGVVDDLQLKVYVDLLQHAVHTHEARLQEFLSVLHWFGEKQPDKTAAMEEAMYMLVGGTVTKPGPGVTETEFRSDYIGLDVDRFFRCTKFAQGGVVTVGERFAHGLQLENSSLPERDEETETIRLPVPAGPASARYAHFTFTRECINKREMKGLKRGYSIFRADHLDRALAVGPPAPTP